MKFSRIIGKIDPKLVQQAEEKLSSVFLELGTRYDNEHVGTGYGGDPLIFSLMYPVDHVCTMNIPTAATDGRRYYWNPKFVLKHSKKGLRIICGHEAWHAIYMHPQRRGSRIPKLWNIAVDYIVNGTCMEDFKSRHHDPVAEFSKNLGRFMPLNVFCELIKNPFQKIAGFEDITPVMQDPDKPSCELPAPDEDRDLTPEEQKELERREKGVRFYYADAALDEEMKRPENIYDLLYSLLPKCPKCGRVGIYPSPKKGKQQGQKGKGQKGQQGKGPDDATTRCRAKVKEKVMIMVEINHATVQVKGNNLVRVKGNQAKVLVRDSQMMTSWARAITVGVAATAASTSSD